LGESHHLLALDAVVLGAGRGLLERGDDGVASTPGECTKIAFLALAMPARNRSGEVVVPVSSQERSRR
jgi:hypothetical protein